MITDIIFTKSQSRPSKTPKRSPAALSQPRIKKAKKAKSKSEPQSPHQSEVEPYRSGTADDVTDRDLDEDVVEISTSGSELSE